MWRLSCSLHVNCVNQKHIWPSLSLSSDICSFFNPALVYNSCLQTPARSLSWSWNAIGLRRAASRWKISLRFAPECSFVLAVQKKKVTLRLFYQHEETPSEGQPAQSVWIKKRRRQCSCDKVINGCCWSLSQITRGDAHSAGITVSFSAVMTLMASSPQ